MVGNLALLNSSLTVVEEKEMKEIWRKYLKNTVLNSYLGKLENQEKAIVIQRLDQNLQLGFCMQLGCCGVCQNTLMAFIAQHTQRPNPFSFPVEVGRLGGGLYINPETDVLSLTQLLVSALPQNQMVVALCKCKRIVIHIDILYTLDTNGNKTH